MRVRRQREEEYERWQRTVPGRLSPGDERAIRSLAGDLPTVWRASTTTPAERQRIARLLIEQIRVVIDKASERVDVELSWVGGLVESHILSRPVQRYDLRTDYPRLVARLRAWCGEVLSTAGIAERLDEEGFRPPKRADRFNRGMVQRLGIGRDTIRRWICAGWVTSRRDAEGHHVIWADSSELARLREIHALPRTWANEGRLAELARPNPRPER